MQASARTRNEARLLDAVAELTAKLTTQEKAVLIGEDRRKQRWRLAAAGVAIMLLFILAVTASIFAVGQRLAVLESEAERLAADTSARKARLEADRATRAQHDAEVAFLNERTAHELAERRRIEAERQARIATGNRLATQANLMLDKDPSVSVLLAIEAARRSGWSRGDRLALVEQALHNALAVTGGVPLPRASTEDAITSDRTRSVVALLGSDGVVRVYDLRQPN